MNYRENLPHLPPELNSHLNLGTQRSLIDLHASFFLE